MLLEPLFQPRIGRIILQFALDALGKYDFFVPQLGRSGHIRLPNLKVVQLIFRDFLVDSVQDQVASLNAIPVVNAFEFIVSPEDVVHDYVACIGPFRGTGFPQENGIGIGDVPDKIPINDCILGSVVTIDAPVGMDSRIVMDIIVPDDHLVVQG